jgi:hypothetical protein
MSTKYIPPFEVVKNFVTIRPNKDELIVGTTYDEFLNIIKMFLRGIDVDEQWYQRTYPDVAESIAAGQIRSAKEHFVENGYFEGRIPRELEIDEEWYRETYDDVRKGLETGNIRSAVDHYREYGYKEGRLPSAF